MMQMITRGLHFWDSLRRKWTQRQKSLISFRGAKSDIFPSEEDPNPILYVGCPRSVGWIKAAIKLYQCLEIEFEL